MFFRALLAVTYLFLALQTTRAFAESPIIDLHGPTSPEQLFGHIDYVLDPDWVRTAHDMVGSRSGDFRPVDKLTPDFGYTPSQVWLRLRARNATEHTKEWRLYFRENFKQIFDVYVARADGTIENTLSQDLERGFSSRPIPFPELVAPVDIEPGERVTLLVRFWSEGSSNLSIAVETDASFAAIAAGRTAKNFVYYGMTMLLIIVALAAMVVMRRGIFLAYAAYAASTLLYLMHSDGVAFQYLWPDWPKFNSVASVVTGSAIIVFGANYARVFLQTRKFHPVFDKLLLAVIAVTLAIDVACFFTDIQPLKKLLVLVALIAIGLFLTSGLAAARTRFKEVRFYVLAWSGAVVSSLIMTLRHWLGVEISQDFQYDSMRVVMVFDATMMGLAIADRYNQLRQSRQSALQASLRQAERNLDLNSRLHELEEQYGVALQLAQSRDEAFRNTVHDLRQPLHALRLNIRNLAGGAPETQDVRAHIDQTFRYLETLVSEQLDSAGDARRDQHASAEKSGGEDLGVPAILKSIHEMFLPDANARGIDFRFAVNGDGVIDPLVLMRVATNLVSNAIKYTPPGGKVLLSARRRGDRLSIAVHDTGPGLSEAEFAEATQRNVRLAKNRHEADGHGYGLAIASELARQHGFTLALVAKRRNGATIVFDIPAR